LQAADEVVRAGGVLLLPTETFYGLAAAPTNAAGVARVFAMKGRPPASPLPVLAADWQQLLSLARVPEEHRVRLSRTWPGALTAVLPAREAMPAAPGGTVAVRIPDHSMVRSLLYKVGPLTGTSANRHGSPPCVDPDAALESLLEPPDLVLDGGPCAGGAATTLVDLTASEPVILRQGVVGWDDFYAQFFPS
jgi:L-threonylcarbamoyladenylate synthase